MAAVLLFAPPPTPLPSPSPSPSRSPLTQEMELSLREHPLWKDDGEDEFHWAVEALEK